MQKQPLATANKTPTNIILQAGKDHIPKGKICNLLPEYIINSKTPHAPHTTTQNKHPEGIGSQTKHTHIMA